MRFIIAEVSLGRSKRVMAGEIGNSLTFPSEGKQQQCEKSDQSWSCKETVRDLNRNATLS